MRISGIESGGLSEGNKKALQSETWQKAREGMKARREIKHFSEEADTEYGAEWSEVVNEYLKTAYKEGDNGCDLEVAGVVYKVLRRDKVTAFYDSDGDTLFDVTNERLEEEYESLKKGCNPASEEESTSEEQKESVEKDSPVPEENMEAENGENVAEKTEEAEKPDSISAVISKNAVDVKERAKKKLEDELKNAKDKSFADPIIKYLLGRCEEDKGLSEDVLQKHKTWEKCLAYVYSLARKRMEQTQKAIEEIFKKNEGTDAFSIKGKGLILVVPRNGDEIKAEGEALHHCVGGYVNRVASGETNIFFIRKAEAPGKSYFTLEYRDNRVIQCRGLHNCDMPPDVKAFVKVFEKKMQDSVQRQGKARKHRKAG